MASTQEKTSISWLRIHRGGPIAILFCLIVVCKSVDSRSISEQPSSLQLEDESQVLSDEAASSNNVAAVNNHDLAKNSDKPLQKRGPYDPKVVKRDVRIQKLLREVSKRNGNGNDRIPDNSFMSREIQMALDAYAQILAEEEERLRIRRLCLGCP